MHETKLYKARLYGTALALALVILTAAWRMLR